MYKREWANFQERLFSKDKVRQELEKRSTVGKPTAASIKEAHFLPGKWPLSNISVLECIMLCIRSSWRQACLTLAQR